MPDDLQIVTEWLLAASKQVPREYMQLPVAGAEGPAYRERVYCYELYHRWRSMWSADFQFSLGGEVDKAGHPRIRGKAKPDFLVHVPGVMDNLLIMEVKSANAPDSKIVKDLRTLDRFRRHLGNDENYRAAYLWIYCLPEDDWQRRRQRLQHSIDALAIDRNGISVILHERPGDRAKFVSW